MVSGPFRTVTTRRGLRVVPRAPYTTHRTRQSQLDTSCPPSIWYARLLRAVRWSCQEGHWRGMPVCTRRQRTAYVTATLWPQGRGASPFGLLEHLGVVVERLLGLLGEREWGALAMLSRPVGETIAGLIESNCRSTVRTCLSVKCRRVSTLRRLQHWALRRGVTAGSYWRLMQQVSTGTNYSVCIELYSSPDSTL